MQTAYIALGSNLPSQAGTPAQTLRAALARLGELGRVTDVSSFYKTAPAGYEDQPEFLNAAAAIETMLAPEQLLGRLLEIERSLGRDRTHSIPNGPRTLDLDLLLYGSEILDSPSLVLPHPRMAERAFVLLPLVEIAPHSVHPVLNRTVSQLANDLPQAREESFHGRR